MDNGQRTMDNMQLRIVYCPFLRGFSFAAQFNSFHQ